ncbi:aldose epimerase family protein [Sphingomonas sp.]|uniref:aldose epimerase family protein n=1 Tax=Sphingomonas sp. TaxID=28214 RepID=UPI003AFF822D
MVKSAGRPTPTATLATFGRLPDGREVPAILLTNTHGLSVRLIAYGAAVQSVMLPDRAGTMADVVLGYATIEEYLAKPQYLGATVGRFANRIARSRFTIDGQVYSTPANDGVNALHGGTVGFDKVLWAVTEVRSEPAASVTMRHVSRDGDQGYPGTMTVDALYRLDDDDRLSIEYRASTDKATIVNITNHTYWNLTGEGSPAGAMGHVVTIPAESFLPTDAGAIPTGEFRSVRDTPFDFRTPRVVGEQVRDAGDQQIVFGRGYDHNWVVGREVTPDLHLMARVRDPVSGRGFELMSNQPGLQFYSGNFLDGTSHGKANRTYRGGDAIVLEPQIFPNTPNQATFGSALLLPDQIYRNMMVYSFTNI